MTLTDKPEKLLIADSQVLITESLKIFISELYNLELIAVVSEKREMLRVLGEEKISLLILDHSLIDFSGIIEIKELLRSYPGLKVLILTNGVSRSELHELNGAGISNVILKTEGKEELFDAINAALKGRKYYSNELLDILFDPAEKKNSNEDIVQLTNSELEIVKLISEGLTTKEIASRKFISFHTVISHRKNIFRKLSVTSVSELIMYALRAGWIDIIEYNI